MPIYKVLEKNWVLKILRKESIFLYSKTRKLEFLSIGVLSSLVVVIFRVTIRGRAQIFIKKANYE